MKIMVFSPVLPLPYLSGNSSRVYNLCRSLKQRGHHIFMVCYLHPVQWKQKDIDFLKKEWDDCVVIPRKYPILIEIVVRLLGIMGIWQNIYQLLGRLKKNSFNQLDDRWSDAITQPFLYEVNKHKPDAVMVEYLFQSKILEYLPSNIKRIIDTHDRFGNRHLNTGYHFYSLTEDDEKKALSRADILIAIQQQEAEYFSKLTHKKTIALGHVLDAKYKDFLYKNPLKLGFIGPATERNKRDLEAFLLCWEKHPVRKNTKIVVAGTIFEILPLRYKNKVESLGKNIALDVFYANVDLLINPIQKGSGLKIKTIEALSYGAPILGTTEAFRGISSDHNFHKLSTAQDMCDAALSVSQNQDLFLDLAIQSRMIFQEYHATIDQAFQELENELKTVSIVDKN